MYDSVILDVGSNLTLGFDIICMVPSANNIVQLDEVEHYTIDKKCGEVASRRVKVHWVSQNFELKK